jgi:hypothetical protein
MNEDPSWKETLNELEWLLRLKGKSYGRHVKSFDHHERLKKARRQRLRRNTDDLSGDMPQDVAGQQALIERLVNAIMKLDKIETPKSSKKALKNGARREIDSSGVRSVKDMNEFEAEMLAWDFMVRLFHNRLSLIQPRTDRCSTRLP